MGSFALLIFSFSIVIFQASCSKEARADNDDNGGNNSGKGKKVLYVNFNSGIPDNSARALWMMNSDGTDNHKINISLPDASYAIDRGRFAENGNKIILTAHHFDETADYGYVFFKCNPDGSGLTQILSGPEIFELQDVY